MTVTLRNDGQIVPNGGTLKPDKDMNIRVDFSVPTDGSVKKGDYTEIALPKEMKFTDTAAIPIMMEIEGSSRQVKLGEVTIDSADSSKATLTFGEEVENEEYLSIEGYFSAGISFDEQQVETSEDKIVVKIFDKEYTIHLDGGGEKVHIDLEKDGTADIKNGKIVWTIKLTPDNDKATYNGYVFTDTLPSNTTYADGSFAVNNSTPSGTLTVNGNKIQYIFPRGTKGGQTITFETTVAGIADAANNYKDIKVKNTAVIKNDGTGDESTGEKTVTIQPRWFKKTGSYNAERHRVTWTLTVNESGAKLKNAVVTDVLGDNLMLDAASVKLDDQDIGTNSAQKPYYTVEGNTLRFYLGDIDGKRVITFSTNVQGVISSVSNQANLTWDNDGSGLVGPEGGLDSGVVTNVSTGFIAKAAGSYDYVNNVMPWTLKVNQAKLTVEHAKVAEIFVYNTDPGKNAGRTTFPSGVAGYEEYAGYSVASNQNLIDGTAACSKGDAAISLSPEIALPDGSKARILTVDLGTIDDMYTITFSSRLTYTTGALGVNGGNSKYTLSNRASLCYGDGGRMTASSAAYLNRHVLEKTLHEGYDYKERTISWRLHINHNRLKLGGAEITDTLPKYFDVADGTFYEIYRGTGAAWNSNPTVRMGEKLTDAEVSAILDGVDVVKENDVARVTLRFKEISDCYVVVLKAKLTDENAAALFAGTNEDVGIRNNATITGVNIEGSQGDYDDQTISNKVIGKSGQLTMDGDGYYTGDVTWTVDVNKNLIDLGEVDKARVIDELSDDLVLNTTANGYDVRMWNMELGADGAWTQGAEIDNKTVQGLIDYQNNVLSVQLPDARGSYRIVFVTRVTDDTAISLNNTARLEGVKTEISSEAKTVKIEYSEGGAYARISGTITAEKLSAKTGEKLEGAKFALYLIGDDGERTHIATKITDSSGKVRFMRLKSGTYEVEELEAPVGYVLSKNNVQSEELDVLNEETKHLTFVFQNDPVRGAVQLRKTDEGGNELAGATFALYAGSVADENLIGEKMTDERGVISWEQLEHGVYVIKEVSAPAGYAMPEEVPEVTAVIDVEGYTAYDTEDEEVPVFINDANTGLIRITKTDMTGKVLGGAEFALYDDRGMELKTATSRVDGIAEFTDIAPGKYTIKEIKAPSGYVRSEEVFGVTEADFTEKGVVIAFTIQNEKESEETPTPYVTLPTGDVPLTEGPGGSETPYVTLPTGDVPLTEGPDEPGGSVKTGDESNLFTWAALMAGAAACGAVLIVVMCRRKRGGEKSAGRHVR